MSVHGILELRCKVRDNKHEFIFTSKFTQDTLNFRNGQPYSYCGISETEVCCFIDYEREPNNTLLEGFLARRELSRLPPKASEGPKNGSITSTKKPVKSIPAIEPASCGKQSVPANLDSMTKFAEWPWHVSWETI